MDFIRERVLNVRFMSNNGMKLQEDNFGHHIKTFLNAYPDPRVETYTREVGVHNVLEMSRFLRILGPQTIQCTLSLDDITISFVFKTTKRTVECIQVIKGRQHSTINFDIDLKGMSGPSQKSKTQIVRGFIPMISQGGSIKRLWNTFRLLVAVGTEVLMWKLPRSSQR